MIDNTVTSIEMPIFYENIYNEITKICKGYSFIRIDVLCNEREYIMNEFEICPSGYYGFNLEKSMISHIRKGYNIDKTQPNVIYELKSYTDLIVNRIENIEIPNTNIFFYSIQMIVFIVIFFEFVFSCFFICYILNSSSQNTIYTYKSGILYVSDPFIYCLLYLAIISGLLFPLMISSILYTLDSESI